MFHMIIDSVNSHLSNGGGQPEHNNNPIAMAILFVIFSINMAISIASATEIIRLAAAIGALIPALGGAYLWFRNNIKKKKL